MQKLTKELVDEVTSAETLKGVLPGIEQFVEAVADVREAMWEARAISNVRAMSGLGDSKIWLRRGHVPFEVVAFLENYVDPNFFRDPKQYEPWFRKHPEYCTSQYKRMIVGK